MNLLKKIFQKFISLLKSLNERRHLVTYKYLSTSQILEGKIGDVVMSCKSDVFCTSPKYYDNVNSDTKNYRKVDYIIKIRNASVVENSDCIFLNTRSVINDLKNVFPDSNIVRYEDFIIKKDNVSKCKIKKNNKIENVNSAIFMGGKYSWNYYHFTYIILSRCVFLNKIDATIPILVDSKVSQFDSMRDLIKYCCGTERKVIWMEPGVLYKIKQLYVVSTPNIIVPDYFPETIVKSEHSLFNVNALEYIRSKMLNEINGKFITKKFPKKFFISRKNAGKGRRYNEQEVIDFLKNNNFEIVYPEQYDLLEQVVLFNNASCIVGGTGAGFTNLLYCQKGCKVIIFTNYDFDISIFSSIAQYCDLNCTYLYDKSIKGEKNAGNIHSSYNVDILELNHLIRV